MAQYYRNQSRVPGLIENRALPAISQAIDVMAGESLRQRQRRERIEREDELLKGQIDREDRRTEAENLREDEFNQEQRQIRQTERAETRADQGTLIRLNEKNREANREANRQSGEADRQSREKIAALGRQAQIKIAELRNGSPAQQKQQMLQYRGKLEEYKQGMRELVELGGIPTGQVDKDGIEVLRPIKLEEISEYMTVLDMLDKKAISGKWDEKDEMRFMAMDDFLTRTTKRQQPKGLTRRQPPSVSEAFQRQQEEEGILGKLNLPSSREAGRIMRGERETQQSPFPTGSLPGERPRTLIPPNTQQNRNDTFGILKHLGRN